jgi:hypothetical protein
MMSTGGPVRLTSERAESTVKRERAELWRNQVGDRRPETATEAKKKKKVNEMIINKTS